MLNSKIIEEQNKINLKKNEENEDILEKSEEKEAPKKDTEANFELEDKIKKDSISKSIEKVRVYQFQFIFFIFYLHFKGFTKARVLILTPYKGDAYEVIIIGSNI